MMFLITLSAFVSVYLSTANAIKGYIPFGEPIKEVVLSRMPHSYLQAEDLPKNFDWRNVNGTNYGSKVLTQQNPSVCGSCWAEAATGALSDRYVIATQGKLRMNLAVQNLLNFKQRITGGSCGGGDSLKAYDFIHKYKLADDTCAPFMGVDSARGFTVSDMVKVADVQAHQCYLCMWSGTCTFVRRDSYDLYGADEFGSVTGEAQMQAEIFARGPIACSVNSDVTPFNAYNGGIITCKQGDVCKVDDTDHVVVIAGWGVDAATGVKYWVGRNSYGTQWGEGVGGGWFRLERGANALAMESHSCSWAVPASEDVQRVLQAFDASVAL